MSTLHKIDSALILLYGDFYSTGTFLLLLRMLRNQDYKIIQDLNLIRKQE